MTNKNIYDIINISKGKRKFIKMDKEFELVTKKKIECYLKATEEIENALNLTIDFLNDLMDELIENQLESVQLANTINTITTLYERCNTYYSINDILDSEGLRA